MSPASDPTPVASPPHPPETTGDPSDIDVLDTPEAGGKVIRGGALLSATYVLGMLLTAVSVPFMTRALGVDEFGLFVTASSAVMIIAGVTEAGLSGIGTREYVVVEKDARRRMLANLIGLRVTLTTTGVPEGLVSRNVVPVRMAGGNQQLDPDCLIEHLAPTHSSSTGPFGKLRVDELFQARAGAPVSSS